MTNVILGKWVRRGVIAASIAVSVLAPGVATAQLMQVRFGVICQTPAGNCQVRPAPIGSLCFCGSAAGTIVG